MNTKRLTWMISPVTLIDISFSFEGESNAFLNDELSIHDVTLLATDVQELAEFYSKLGFCRDPHVNNENMVVFPFPSSDLAIHKSDKDSRINMSFMIGDLDMPIKNLRRHSIDFSGPNMLRPGIEGIEIDDPNGNRLSFLKSME